MGGKMRLSQDLLWSPSEVLVELGKEPSFPNPYSSPKL